MVGPGLRPEDIEVAIRSIEESRETHVAWIGHDANEHHLGQAHLLTSTWSVQRSGATAIGGGRSLDQEIAARSHSTTPDPIPP